MLIQLVIAVLCRRLGAIFDVKTRGYPLHGYVSTAPTHPLFKNYMYEAKSRRKLT